MFNQQSFQKVQSISLGIRRHVTGQCSNRSCRGQKANGSRDSCIICTALMSHVWCSSEYHFILKSAQCASSNAGQDIVHHYGNAFATALQIQAPDNLIMQLAVMQLAALYKHAHDGCCCLQPLFIQGPWCRDLPTRLPRVSGPMRRGRHRLQQCGPYQTSCPAASLVP